MSEDSIHFLSSPLMNHQGKWKTAVTAHNGETMLWLSMEINSLYLINVVESIMITFTLLNPYQSTVIIIIRKLNKN
jgi:hypothetical protein